MKYNHIHLHPSPSFPHNCSFLSFIAVALQFSSIWDISVRVVAHACNLSIWEAGQEELIESQARDWAIEWDRV